VGLSTKKAFASMSITKNVTLIILTDLKKKIPRLPRSILIGSEKEQMDESES
jgi:hypothetical protein